MSNKWILIIILDKHTFNEIQKLNFFLINKFVIDTLDSNLTLYSAICSKSKYRRNMIPSIYSNY